LFRRSAVPGEHRSAIPSGHRSAGATQGGTIDMWQLWGDYGLSEECSTSSGQEDTRQSDEAGNSETDMFEVALGWGVRLTAWVCWLQDIDPNSSSWEADSVSGSQEA